MPDLASPWGFDIPNVQSGFDPSTGLTWNYLGYVKVIAGGGRPGLDYDGVTQLTNQRLSASKGAFAYIPPGEIAGTHADGEFVFVGKYANANEPTTDGDRRYQAARLQWTEPKMDGSATFPLIGRMNDIPIPRLWREQVPALSGLSGNGAPLNRINVHGLYFDSDLIASTWGSSGSNDILFGTTDTYNVSPETNVWGGLCRATLVMTDTDHWLRNVRGMMSFEDAGSPLPTENTIGKIVRVPSTGMPGGHEFLTGKHWNARASMQFNFGWFAFDGDDIGTAGGQKEPWTGSPGTRFTTQVLPIADSRGGVNGNPMQGPDIWWKGWTSFCASTYLPNHDIIFHSGNHGYGFRNYPGNQTDADANIAGPPLRGPFLSLSEFLGAAPGSSGNAHYIGPQDAANHGYYTYNFGDPAQLSSYTKHNRAQWDSLAVGDICYYTGSTSGYDGAGGVPQYMDDIIVPWMSISRYDTGSDNKGYQIPPQCPVFMIQRMSDLRNGDLPGYGAPQEMITPTDFLTGFPASTVLSYRENHGSAWDPIRNYLYVCESEGVYNATIDSVPVVHVFALSSNFAALTVPMPTMTAVGASTSLPTGIAVMTMPMPTMTGSGTHLGLFSGDSTLTVPMPTLTGSGTSESGTVPVSGSGSLTIPMPTITGSGTVSSLPDEDIGTASLTVPMPTITGTGTAAGGPDEDTGTASLTVPMPTITGTGTAAGLPDEDIGTAVMTVPMPTIVGLGSVHSVDVDTGFAGLTAPMPYIHTAFGTSSGGNVNTGAFDATMPMPTLTAFGAVGISTLPTFSPLKRRAPVSRADLRRRGVVQDDGLRRRADEHQDEVRPPR